MSLVDTRDSIALRSSDSLTSRLDRVDWSYSSRTNHSTIEGIHPYPAKFIAELPRTLLELLPMIPGTAVMDPFCGSGTVLVESQRLGLPSVGIDLNPIACLITRVKTGPLPPDLNNVARIVADTARHDADVAPPIIPNLDHWFLPTVQEALTALARAIADAPSEYSEPLRLALSSIIVRVSNQDSDTRYAAVNKDVTASDVYRYFSNSAARIQKALSDRSYSLTSAQVVTSDTLQLDPAQIHLPISLVITSPPYPNAYEYWLYHKYRMYWLGFDPIAVRSKEIGARCHFFKRDHHTADDFKRQMTITLKLLREVLVSNGFACFVIGRSIIHGESIDNARMLKDIAPSLGFEVFFQTERHLAASRKSFNPAYGKIKSEHILILRRRS